MEEGGRADSGYKSAARGHVHLDVTGKPIEGPEWSKRDINAARQGETVYKVIESESKQVYRLTPQKNPEKDQPTTKVLEQNISRAARQMEIPGLEQGSALQPGGRQ